MKVDIADYRNTESGAVVILGNGPSLDNYQDKTFKCPVIGINMSYLYAPKQDYYLTVARDRLDDIAQGKIKAEKAIFTCTQRVNRIPEDSEQKILCADMSIQDVYSEYYNLQCLFHCDLTRPILATFGGIYAIQAAFFLGFNPIYLIGFEGGGKLHCSKHPLLGKGWGPLEHHIRVHWHVHHWLQHNPGFEIYQAIPDSGLPYYPYAKDFENEYVG